MRNTSIRHLIQHSKMTPAEANSCYDQLNDNARSRLLQEARRADRKVFDKFASDLPTEDHEQVMHAVEPTRLRGELTGLTAQFIMGCPRWLLEPLYDTLLDPEADHVGAIRHAHLTKRDADLGLTPTPECHDQDDRALARLRQSAIAQFERRRGAIAIDGLRVLRDHFEIEERRDQLRFHMTKVEVKRRYQDSYSENQVMQVHQFVNGLKHDEVRERVLRTPDGSFDVRADYKERASSEKSAMADECLVVDAESNAAIPERTTSTITTKEAEYIAAYNDFWDQRAAMPGHTKIAEALRTILADPSCLLKDVPLPPSEIAAKMGGTSAELVRRVQQNLYLLVCDDQEIPKKIEMNLKQYFNWLKRPR